MWWRWRGGDDKAASLKQPMIDLLHHHAPVKKKMTKENTTSYCSAAAATLHRMNWESDNMKNVAVRVVFVW